MQFRGQVTQLRALPSLHEHFKCSFSISCLLLFNVDTWFPSRPLICQLSHSVSWKMSPIRVTGQLKCLSMMKCHKAGKVFLDLFHHVYGGGRLFLCSNKSSSINSSSLAHSCHIECVLRLNHRLF